MNERQTHTGEEHVASASEIASLSFEGWDDKIRDEMPSNEEMLEWGKDLAVWQRVCAVLCTEDDKKIESHFQEEQTGEVFLKVYDQIVDMIENIENQLHLFQAASARLMVGMARFEERELGNKKEVRHDC